MHLALGMVLWGGAREELEHLTIDHYERSAWLARSDVRVTIVPFSEWPDRPLGERHNGMLACCRDYAPDAFILVGSDDWMAKDCFVKYARWAERSALVALHKLSIADAATGRIVQIRSPAIGVGRMVRRDVLDRCGWRLWDDKLERRLDASMMQRIAFRGRASCSFTTDADYVAALDIKTGQNLWAFDHFMLRGKPVSPEARRELFTQFHPQTIERLQRLYPKLTAEESVDG